MSFEEEEGFPPEKSLAPVRNIMGNGATSIIFFQEIGSVCFAKYRHFKVEMSVYLSIIDAIFVVSTYRKTIVS